MMNGLWKKTITFLTHLLSWMLIIAMATLVLDVIWGVVTRAVGDQVSWSEELATILLVWVSLLGGALAFQTKAHLGVDYFVGKFDPEVAKRMAIMTLGLVLFFAVAVFLVGGGQKVYKRILFSQFTPVLGLPKSLVYSILPLSGFFMVLFTIDNLLKVLRTPADEFFVDADNEDEAIAVEVQKEAN